jgi:hypothetical protein
VSPDDPRDPSIDDAYRATAREEPPRELDERILAAAHRAVDARPSPVRRPFAQRWRVPVAIAATVVLSATVTLMVYENDRTTGGVSDKIQEESAPPTSAAPSAAGKPAAKRGALPSQSDAQTAAPRPAAPTDESGAARAPAAPAAAGALRQSVPREAEGSPANEAKRKSAPFAAEPARVGVPPAVETPQSGSDQRTLMEKREAPAAAPSPTPPLSRERALADRPTGRSERDTASGTARSALQSPDDWLAEIRRLKQAGRTDEASRLLADFRDRFPDHPLPEDLR